MFRKLRRRFAHRSIRKFLEEFLPNIDLGEVEKFECRDFRLGDYAVHTSKGVYKITFWELCYGAKEFILNLNYEGGKGEFIVFSITGNFLFDIKPETHTIDRNGERQVVKLAEGCVNFYPRGSEYENRNYRMIEYKSPVMKSEIISIDKLIEEGWAYIFR